MRIQDPSSSTGVRVTVAADLASALSGARFYCPCCGLRTLTEAPPGTFAICAVCWWEDDSVQFHDPGYEGGANGLSLREYQRQFLEGNLEFPDAGRSVGEVEIEVERDPEWKPFQATNGRL